MDIQLSCLSKNSRGALKKMIALGGVESNRQNGDAQKNIKYKASIKENQLFYGPITKLKAS
jgi:hypothetical protein